MPCVEYVFQLGKRRSHVDEIIAELQAPLVRLQLCIDVLVEGFDRAENRLTRTLRDGTAWRACFG